ncbi:MAG: hypothetical protein J2P17_21050 [Mycobacterium sp.]|nr:hypothetical protein [Mycobacterium sp.]
MTITASDGRGAIRPLPAPTGCTTTIRRSSQLAAVMHAAGPGNRICIVGDLSNERLVVENSGIESARIEIVGDGRTTVRGITVEANNILISGINAVRPRAPRISLVGNNIILINSTSISPRGGDGDGIRFWGNQITISHDTVRDTLNLYGAHADCMQTFATDEDRPTSTHVRITHNRCEGIANTCLIAEGPFTSDGIHHGKSEDFLFSDNFCENHASEATEIDGIQDVTIAHNQLTGQKDMAFSFQDMATGGHVTDNTIAPEIDHEVGMDNSSKAGYRGPEARGGP